MVLPTPPGPTSVTSRAAANRRATPSRSSSRPTTRRSRRRLPVAGRHRGPSSDGSWTRFAVSSRRSSVPGSRPVRSASTDTARRQARRASVWRPARVSAVMMSAHRRSSSGSSLTSRPSSASARSTSPPGSAPRPAPPRRPALVVDRGRPAARAGSTSRRSDRAGPRQSDSALAQGAAASTGWPRARGGRPVDVRTGLVEVDGRGAVAGLVAAQGVATGDGLDAGPGPPAGSEPPQPRHVPEHGPRGRRAPAGHRRPASSSAGSARSRCSASRASRWAAWPRRCGGLPVGPPHARA